MGIIDIIVKTITAIGKVFIFCAQAIAYVGWIIEMFIGLSIEKIGYAASHNPIVTIITVVVLTAICVVSTYFILKGMKSFIVSGIMVCFGLILLIVGGLYVTKYWVDTTGVLGSIDSSTTSSGDEIVVNKTHLLKNRFP